MVFYEQLTEPWLHLVILDAASVADRISALATQGEEAAVRVVRAAKMGSEAQTFDELSAAFQFPYYFGENWDALSECINDLSWMPARRYLTVITNAHLLRSKDHAETLLQILGDAGREWSQPAPSARPWAPEPRAFHVVLQANPGQAEDVAELLAAAGVPHDRRDWARAEV
jgi:RNAse (barnase) inhibitor barstar